MGMVYIYSHFTGALQVRGVHRVRVEFQRQRDADRLHRKSSISAKELLEREMALPMDRHFFLSNSRVERPPQSPSRPKSLVLFEKLHDFKKFLRIVGNLTPCHMYLSFAHVGQP